LRRVCAILLLLSASCSAWRPLPGVGLARTEEERLGHAKLFMRDGMEIELEDATISPDSIVGLGGVGFTGMAVARSEVAGVDTRRTHLGKTSLAGALAPVFLAFLYVVAVQADRDH
jgi:hypothetical protein